MSHAFIVRAVTALALCALASSCKSGPSEQEIERWKAADQRGQIAGALTAPKSALNIRVKAARALIELAADAHFADGLKKLDSGTRAQVSEALTPELDKLLTSGELAKAILGKDFLGLIILAGDEAAAKTSGAKVMAWLGVDFTRRIAMGRVSGLEVAKRIGPPGLPALLGAFKPNVDLVVLAKIVSAIGDAKGIAQAADKVVAIAKTQGPKVPERTLKALFTLGGPNAAVQLATLASDPKLSFPTRRAAAEEMRALAQPAALQLGAKLALDNDGDQLVRESALVYMEKVCDAKTCGVYMDGLWSALKNQSLIFESASAIVKVGGAGKLAALLSALPKGRRYTPKAVESLADDIQKNIGAAALPSLRRALDEDGPGALVAIRALAKLGTAEDAKALLSHKGSDTVPEGWRGKTTLGQEAERAAKEVSARK